MMSQTDRVKRNTILRRMMKIAMDEPNHLSALTTILNTLERLSPASRRRVLEAVAAFYPDESKASRVQATPPNVVLPASTSAPVPFSQKKDTTFQEFLEQKRPKTGIEKVVCFGFYLNQYLGVDRFNNFELTKLNEEAGKFRVNELARRILDAVQQRYLLRHPDSRKSVTARGQNLVFSLPVQDADAEAQAKNSARTKDDPESQFKNDWAIAVNRR